MKYAIELALKNLNAASNISEELHGLSFYENLQKLNKNLDIKTLLFDFNKIAKDLFQNFDLLLGCDQKKYEEIKKDNFYNLTASSSHNFLLQKEEKQKPIRIGKIISSPVAFNAMAFNTINYLDESAPAIKIISNIMDNKVLHPIIREQNGAYGSGSRYCSSTGNFYFYSFRDPNLANTFITFEKAIDQIISGNFSENDIQDAKFQAFQGLDIPISPGHRTYVSYNMLRSGKTYEMKNEFRKKLINLNKDKLIETAEKHIKPHIEKANCVSFASKKIFEKENGLLIKPFLVSNVS